MNTKQKITLGIVAVTMIAITVMGVTYAYFVTRVVEPSSPVKADITTAQISVKYGDENGIITLDKIIPGTDVYKVFSVENTGTADAAYYLTVKQTAGEKQFLHSTYANSASSDSSKECYNVDVTTLDGETYDYKTKPSNCYSGNDYDNVYITVVEDTSNASLSTNGSDETGQQALKTAFENAKTAHTIIDEQKLTAGSNEKVFNDKQQLIAAPKDSGTSKKTYIAKVSYKSVDANQNLENEASVSILFNIK